MWAWYYLAGRSPEQLVIDLFAQHQRVAVCFSVKWLLTFDAPNEKDQKRVENHLGLHSEKKQLITQCLYQRLPSFTKKGFLTFQSAKKSAIFTDLLLCYAEHGPNQIEIAESNFILIRQYISWALTTYHVSYRVHNKLKPVSITSNSVGPKQQYTVIYLCREGGTKPFQQMSKWTTYSKSPMLCKKVYN